MPFTGCHLSSSKGYEAMGKQALTIGADTFQFFTRNPRGGSAKPMDEADAAALCALCAQHGFGPLVAHAPYTLNACAAKDELRTFARETMTDDLARLEFLPAGTLYNFHPGSHVGQGAAVGIPLIAEALNAVLTPGQHTTVLLETMAGKGSEVGSSFAQLAEILSRVSLNDKMGVCLDTCHVWDGGYDIVNDLDGVLTAFDKEIGLSRLRALHINDSLNERGAAKDRHAQIGCGKIGAAALLRVVRHPALAGLPMCLETPNELPGYAAEIAFLRTGDEAALAARP